MKISLKIDPETLFILHNIIVKESQMIANNRAQRSGKSMRVELFEVICKRCITYSSNRNGKKITLTLKYHLASLIYDILSDFQFSFGGIYEQNKLEMFKNDLHQKLL